MVLPTYASYVVGHPRTDWSCLLIGFPACVSGGLAWVQHPWFSQHKTACQFIR